MAKIERKYLAHFIDVDAEGKGVYERLGKDLEEYTTQMSAQVDTKKNILGESSVRISGYEKTAAVEPYYAEAGTGLFRRLQQIIDEGMVLDQLKTHVVEVKLWEQEEDGGFPAIREEAYLEVTGYGGDISGYQIPFTIHYTGAKEKGVFQLADKTFVPQEA